MNNNLLNHIKKSILETIKDPDSPDARKSDCYANCGQFIHNNKDGDYSIMIYGYKGNPMHGIVIDNKNDEIVVDTFASKRKGKEGDEIIYHDGHKEIKLEVIEKMSSSLWNDRIEELDFPEIQSFKEEKKSNIKRNSQNKIKPL